MDSIGKKKLWIFIAVAYGVTAVMSILMVFGFKMGNDLTVFVNTQMMYPAAGVILGKLIARKEGEKLPMGGFITFLITTGVMMVLSILSIIIHIEPYSLEAGGATTTLDVWNVFSQLVLMTGSAVAYILFWTCGKEIRANAGLSHKNIKAGAILVAIFVALIFGRSFISVFLSDLMSGTHQAFESFKGVLGNFAFWINLLALPINYFLVFIAFFGEEYGWRYYLQPIMQDKFGKRLGVLILGLVWAVWHINVDFMYYTVEDGPKAFVSQIITCIVIAIFFGYAYMKTGNIWVPVIMHYLNNNIAALMAGGKADALQNQSISWSDIPIHLASCVVFALFILMPLYNKNKEAKNAEV